MFKSAPIYVNSKIDPNIFFSNIIFCHVSFSQMFKLVTDFKTLQSIILVCDSNKITDILKFIFIFCLRFTSKTNFFVVLLNQSNLFKVLIKLNELLISKRSKKRIVLLHDYITESGSLKFYNFINFKSSLNEFQVEAFIPHKNDFDTLFHVVNHLLNNDIKIHIIDDFSDEEIKNKITNTFAENPNILITFLENQNFEILKFIDNLSKNSTADFIIRCDSDEYLFSNIENMSLKEFLLYVSSTEFQFIDSTVVDLYSETLSYISAADATHLAFSQDFCYQKVLRAWRNDKTLNGGGDFGHFIDYETKGYFPMNLTLFHASLRNLTQANEKIVKRRIKRDLAIESQGGHSHYLIQSALEKMQIPTVNYRNNDNFWKLNQGKRKYRIGILPEKIVDLTIVSYLYGNKYDQFLSNWLEKIRQSNIQPKEVLICTDFQRNITGVHELVIPIPDHVKYPNAFFLNLMINYAETEWILVLDIDDEIYPNFLDGFDQIKSDVYLAGLNSDKNGIYMPPLLTNERVVGNPYNSFCFGSPFKRRLALESPFQEHPYTDWIFWRDIARKNVKFELSNKVGYRYRDTDNSMSNLYDNEDKFKLDVINNY
jgi:hypothetical protein